MFIYVVYDKVTKEELAFHISNGETLKRWKKDLESQGFKCGVKRRKQKK